MTDERPDSLAAQAASWVPPWERQQRPPDRRFQAAAEQAADGHGQDGDLDDAGRPDGPVARAGGPGPGDPGAADLSDDDDDFDENFEGPNPEGYDEEVPPELAPLPGEASGPAAVDAPAELPGEEQPEATDVGSPPDVPIPAAVEDAAEEALEEERGPAVDAPLPAGGDDAGDVFDAAADDDVSDDGEMEVPITPEGDGTGGDDGSAEDGESAEDSESAEDGGTAADDGTAEDGETAEDDATAPDDGTGRDDGTVNDDGTGDEDRIRGDEGGRDGDPFGGGATTDSAVAAFAVGQADAQEALAGAAGRAKPRAAVPAQGRGTDHPGAAVGAADGRTGNGVDLEEGDRPALPALDDAELRAALEAVLLVVDEPVAEMQLAQIMEQPTERVAAMLEDISARYTAAGHGFDLRRAAGGWRLYTRPEYASYVERFVLDGQSVRLTQAALETLAVVAYKQPVTRSRISAIRGVNCDGVMRTLVTRGLIEECGTEGETGAYLYRTTPLFLEKLGLNAIDQLPPLAPFLPDDVEEVLDASG